MSDSQLCFIDTNILVYFVSDDMVKKNIAMQILSSKNIVISTQVLNEFCNVVLRKNIISYEELIQSIKTFTHSFKMVYIDSPLILKAINIKNTYHYSYWDSLMIACALNANAATLYSEDMHHGQIIDHQLTIINPFQS